MPGPRSLELRAIAVFPHAESRCYFTGSKQAASYKSIAGPVHPVFTVIPFPSCGQADGQCVCGIVQRNLPGRMPGCPLVYDLDRNPADRRDLAKGIQ
jgi:hypothetical protein